MIGFYVVIMIVIFYFVVYLLIVVHFDVTIIIVTIIISINVTVPVTLIIRILNLDYFFIETFVKDSCYLSLVVEMTDFIDEFVIMFIMYIMMMYM